jgi:hypothetical protein
MAIDIKALQAFPKTGTGFSFQKKNFKGVEESKQFI